MSVFIGGIISIIIFYILVLGVGIWAGKKQNSTEKNPDTEEIMLAGRNIGILVGVFTMTATWVGGGFINLSAEVAFTDGLLWCQLPIGYAFNLIFGGLLFARKMRREGYVTMIDPFQKKYGERMGGLMFIPALLGEIFWTGAILTALGGTISVIMDLDEKISIIVSAIVVVTYTLFGGLYSVAYTDVVQLFCIFAGLILVIPFASSNKAVSNVFENSDKWLGSIQTVDIFLYLDQIFLITFGGIPWQVYFQRVLSAKTEKSAMYTSFLASIGCFIAGLPPITIGIIAKSTDWNATDYASKLPFTENSRKLILPLVLQYLTPFYVSFFGLGAVTAAVMSSADSSILSASSMFARNIWKFLIRPKSSEVEMLWVMRLGILIFSLAASFMGIYAQSIYQLWYLSSDLVYVVLFPQLTSVIYLKNVNTYGAMAGYLVGIVMRILAGEPLFSIPPLIKYPLFDPITQVQKFPFRTFGMLISLFLIITISNLTKFIFENNYLSKKYDIFKCFSYKLVEPAPPSNNNTNDINDSGA